MDAVLPVYVRVSPKFDMRTEKNTFFTIVVMDATYGFVHGLFVDYPTPRASLVFSYARSRTH